jgi:hypothetical protein
VASVLKWLKNAPIPNVKVSMNGHQNEQRNDQTQEVFEAQVEELALN